MPVQEDLFVKGLPVPTGFIATLNKNISHLALLQWVEY